MAGEPIQFPTSTAPSRNPTEAGGRLINAYAEKAPEGSRSQVIWRRAPGMTEWATVEGNEPRGAISVGSVLYVVNGDKAYTIAGGTITELTGTVPGSGPIILARNMRAPIPQIVGVTSSGVTQFTDSAASDFSDADLPSPNSVVFLDGYFFFTTAAGLVFASGINDLTINELDFATAEASVDGLRRAVAYNSDLLLMGETSIEFWSNTGNATGFPFTRSHVLPIGLISTYAVAGHEYGFTSPLMWVGNDHAVYRLEGYSPARISTPSLERLIEDVADPDTLEASVFETAGRSFWVLSSPSWTWVFDTGTGFWHERKSIGLDYWRGRFGVSIGGDWLVLERGSGRILRMDARVHREGLAPLVFDVRSHQMHRFPGRMVVSRASFDLVTGVGRDKGIAPVETDPKVSISWSDDGGVSFGNALLRRLGTQGEQTGIDVWRCGLTGRNGRQWRVQISDPVEVAMMGGAVDLEARSA